MTILSYVTVWVGSRNQLQSSVKFHTELKIAGMHLPPVQSLKIIGVMLNSQHSFNNHVTDVCRAVNFHLRGLSHIRRYLDVSTANMLDTSIVSSRIDYCNSLLFGLSDYNVQRLQRVQNLAAKIVLNVRGRVSSAPLLQQLHWLPVSNRIIYKIALTTFKTLTTQRPEYLSSLLVPYSTPCSLRSSSQHLLSVPFSKTVFQSRAFSICAPKIWNRLPQHLCN